MIFALRHPAVLLGLLLGFLVGVVLRAAVQRRLTLPRGGGSRRRGRLRAVGRGGGTVAALTPSAGWAAYLDPYGTVAAVLSGAGWGARQTARRRGWGSDIGLVVAAVVVHGALAVAGFAAFNAAGSDYRVFADVNATTILHGSLAPPTVGQSVAAGFGMVNLACGLLALVPIPPLELGVVLWSRLPRSPGARRFAYHLLEEAWGVAVVLLLLLLPLAGQQPVILALIDTTSKAIFGAL